MSEMSLYKKIIIVVSLIIVLGIPFIYSCININSDDIPGTSGQPEEYEIIELKIPIE